MSDRVFEPTQLEHTQPFGRRYIVSAWYDGLFFLLAPLTACVAGAALSYWPDANATFWLGARRSTPVLFALGALVHAHLVAVFARSHLDKDVFRAHPFRCTVVPLATLGAMLVSNTVMLVATVVVVGWDVYHSAMQTFGLGRFYDRIEGNDVLVGRRLDIGLNLLLYIGPILSGASLAAHLEKIELLDDTPFSSLTSLPELLLSSQPQISRWVWLSIALYLVAYIAAQFVFWRRGFVISLPKVFLLTSTGACSLFVWANNPWGMAFFIMNVFHAVQYLALVWWKQRSTLVQKGRNPLVVLAVFLGVVLLYGAVAEAVTDEQRVLWCITQTVALMHFYYDGFIWSVRKKSLSESITRSSCVPTPLHSLPRCPVQCSWWAHRAWSPDVKRWCRSSRQC
ncbi:MAG: hypothetical protein U0165_12435 [Polyangiaceae bacterium]